MVPSGWMKLNFKKAVAELPVRPTIVEIGSHVGDGVAYMLKQRPLATIYAIEPCKDSFSRLIANHKESTMVAIVGCNSTCTLSLAGNSRQYRMVRNGTEVVPQMLLDDFLDDKQIGYIDLLRFDCYGSEYRIFHSNNRFLQQTSAICITMQKANACEKGMDVKAERKHVWDCLYNANFVLSLRNGKGVSNHLFEYWVKE